MIALMWLPPSSQGLEPPGGGWLVKTGDRVTLYYQEPDQELVEALWPLIEKDRKTIMEALRMFPDVSNRIVLAPTLAVFNELHPMPLYKTPPLGIYSLETKTIYLRAPRTGSSGLWDLRDVLQHELVHALLDLSISYPIPLWLHEGLALLLAREMSFLDEAGLTLRAATGQLIPLRELLYRFPDTHQNRTHAYAQAASFVRFLLARQQMEGLMLLLEKLGKGVSIDEALYRIYGLDLGDLQQEWENSLSLRFSWTTVLTSSGILGALSLPLIAAALIRRHLKNRRIKTRWQIEEIILQEATEPTADISPKSDLLN